MTLSFDLRAGETYPAVWIPADATDTTTYYPQAVFRNALSFAVIATVNLTKQTDGSYTGNFTVPQDPSGLGMILLETVTIYTDAGHTSATNLYGILQNKHKVVNANANFGGGGNFEGGQKSIRPLGHAPQLKSACRCRSFGQLFSSIVQVDVIR